MKYHDAAHTLDPNIEIPEGEEAAPSAGHDEEMSAQVKEQSDAVREQAEAEREAEAERAAEWAERDPKPTPTEFGQEFNREPVPDEESAPKATE